MARKYPKAIPGWPLTPGSRFSPTSTRDLTGIGGSAAPYVQQTASGVWSVIRDMTVGSAVQGVGYGAVQKSFHGFQWDLSWSADSNYLTCACGEGDVGLFRAFVGSGAPAIILSGWVNQGTYFYMDGCDEGGNHVVGTGVPGFINGMLASPQMQTLWTNTIPSILGAPNANSRKVFIDSAGTNGFWVVNMNPGTILALNAATGNFLSSIQASGGNSWDEGSGLGMFTAEYEKTRNLLCCGNGFGYIFDLSNPATPSNPFFTDTTAVFACCINGNRMFTHDCNGGFKPNAPGNIMVWNVATPASASVVFTYPVPTSGPGSHPGNAIYNQLCVSPDGHYVFGAWGGGIDVLRTAAGGAGAELVYVTQIPALVSPPSGSNVSGGAIGYLSDGFGMKVSPNNNLLAVEWGSGGSVSGSAGVTIYDISNKASITQRNYIGTGAETKSSVMDSNGVVFTSTQYNYEVFDNTGHLVWASLPQANTFASFRLAPFKDMNTWIATSHPGLDTTIWRTNGAAAATLLAEYFDGSGVLPLGPTIAVAWDGYNLQVVNNGGTANAWGWQVFTVGSYVSDLSSNNYPVSNPVDTWIDTTDFPLSQANGQGAIYIDGRYGVAGSKTWISDQHWGVVVLDTSTPGSVTMLKHDPIISTNSPNAASFGGPSTVPGSTLDVGSAADLFVLYTQYYTDVAMTQPMGYLPWAYDQAHPDHTQLPDMSGFTPGTGAAITLQLQAPAGAKGVKIFGYKNPYGNPSFGWIPYYTGSSYTNAGGIPYPHSIDITTATSTWTVPMPAYSGSPALAGTTGGFLDLGGAFTGAVVYRDQFGEVCGWDYMGNCLLSGSQNAISVNLPGSGSGLTPPLAVTQELWMIEHVPGSTNIGPYEIEGGALYVTEVGQIPVATTNVLVTGPVVNWGSAANNPISFVYGFAQWSYSAFSAPFGTSSITTVGIGANRRIVVGCGDSGGRIYNPTTLVQTGVIPGFANGGSTLVGHTTLENRYTVTQNYSAAAVSGISDTIAWDHFNHPDAPIKNSSIGGDQSQGFSCTGADYVYPGITWYTPQPYVIISSLSGPKVIRPPS